MATKEFFPGIEKIKFEGKDSKNPMAFRYYDAEKVINGKKMKDWLRFAMAWWHTLCAEGGGCLELHSDVILIIFLQKGTVNDIEEVLLMLRPIFLGQFSSYLQIGRAHV